MLISDAVKKLVQRLLVIALIALVVASSTGLGRAVTADGMSDGERSAISLVSAERIRTVTTDLSAPGMEGRGTAQPGGDRAAKCILPTDLLPCVFNPSAPPELFISPSISIRLSCWSRI